MSHLVRVQHEHLTLCSKREERKKKRQTNTFNSFFQYRLFLKLKLHIYFVKSFKKLALPSSLRLGRISWTVT